MSVPADLIAFAVALIASLGLTVPVRRLALRYGMVDLPGPRKVHVKPMPLLGGIAIYLGFVLAILLTLHADPQQQIVGILAGATLVAAVGVLDDGGLLHHQVKLFIGMPVAALFLIASGIRAQFFSQFVPGSARRTILDGCLTMLWVVGITASFSILDHMDGLCAGIAAVARRFFTISASLNGQTMVRTLGAATLGAALGFLRWNFNPAKIFMGDGGAMFLGFLMAMLGLKIRSEGVSFRSNWLVPDPDSGSADLRYDAGLDLPGTPRSASVHFARQGSHRAPPVEPRPRASRRRTGSLLPGGSVWDFRAASSLAFARNGLCACRGAGGVRIAGGLFPRRCALRTPGEIAEVLLHYLKITAAIFFGGNVRCGIYFRPEYFAHAFTE